MKSAAFKAAPPISPPSTSLLANNSFALEGLQLPPYKIEVFSATSLPYLSAIGLEFASRGAKKVYLCDVSKKAVEVIKKNIEKTHLEEKVETYNLDFQEMIKKLKGKKLDIIYLDPPYKTDFIKKAIYGLIEGNLINENTLIIAETDEEKRIIKELEEFKNIEIIDKRKYGRAQILFLKKNNLTRKGD